MKMKYIQKQKMLFQKHTFRRSEKYSFVDKMKISSLRKGSFLLYLHMKREEKKDKCSKDN